MIELEERPKTVARKALARCCKPLDLVRSDLSATTAMSLFSFSAECLTDMTILKIDEVATFVGKCSTVWIDVEGLSDKCSVNDLLKIVEVNEALGKNLFQASQPALLQQYMQESLLVIPILKMDGSLELQQLAILQKGNTVITLHEHKIPAICRIKEEVRNQHSLLDRDGRLYLLQRFVEASIDSFQPILEEYSKELEGIEDEILEQAQWETVWDIHRARKELLILKRIMVPLHNTLRQYSRDAEYYSGEGDKRVARELYQHGTSMFEMVEYYINVTSELLNLHMACVSNKMNQCMTVLAIVAAVFLPPSLVASIYGMNFYEHNSPWNMPELGWDLGYPFALFLMTGISVMFLLYFWKNGWLKVFYPNHQKK
jgi:magnesium transporter